MYVCMCTIKGSLKLYIHYIHFDFEMSSDEGALVIDDGFVDDHSGWAKYVVAEFLQKYENPTEFVDKDMMMDFIDRAKMFSQGKYKLEEFTSHLHDWLYCKAFFEQSADDYQKEVEVRTAEIDKVMTCDCIEGNRRYNEWYDKEMEFLPKAAMMSVADEWLDSQIAKNNISPVRRPFIRRQLDQNFTPIHYHHSRPVIHQSNASLDTVDCAEEPCYSDIDDDDDEPQLCCAELDEPQQQEVENADFLKNVVNYDILKNPLIYTAPEEIEIRQKELEDVMDERKVMEALNRTAEVLPEAYLAYCNYRDDFVQMMIKNPYRMQDVMVSMLQNSHIDVSDMQFCFDRVEYCLNSVPAFDEQQRQLTNIAREFLEEIFGKPVSQSLHEIKMSSKRQRDDDDFEVPAKSDNVFDNICMDLGLTLAPVGDGLHKKLASLIREFVTVKSSLQLLTRKAIEDQIDLLKYLMSQNLLTPHHITFVSNMMKQITDVHVWIIKNYGRDDDYRRFCRLTTMPELEKLHHLDCYHSHVKLLVFIDYILRYDVECGGVESYYLREIAHDCTFFLYNLLLADNTYPEGVCVLSADVEILRGYHDLWEKFCYQRNGGSYKSYCTEVPRRSLRIYIKRPDRLQYVAPGQSKGTPFHERLSWRHVNCI